MIANRSGGFTLVEMIVTIVISGIVVALVSMFIRHSVQSYTDTAQRAALTDAADTALRRMSRDLRRALPNSVRVPTANQCLEFIPTITGGRYRVELPGNIVDTTATINSFDYFGTLNPTPAVGDWVVIYNLGIAGASAYRGDNIAAIGGIDTVAGTVTLASAMQFPFDSPSKRFQVVPNADKAVFYSCSGQGITDGEGTGILYRHANYGFNAADPANCNAPGGATTSVLATKVSDCNFIYAAGSTQRSGLVSMRLALTRNGETVNLYHEVHVNNVP